MMPAADGKWFPGFQTVYPCFQGIRPHKQVIRQQAPIIRNLFFIFVFK